MFKKIIEKVKDFKRFMEITNKDAEPARWFYRFSFDDGSYILIDEEQKADLHYFCDEEGIKYGSTIKNANKLIIPKDILVEAINKYMCDSNINLRSSDNS